MVLRRVILFLSIRENAVLKGTIGQGASNIYYSMIESVEFSLLALG